MKWIANSRLKKVWGILLSIVVMFICVKLAKPDELVKIAKNLGWSGLVQIFSLVAITQLLRALRFFILFSLRNKIQYNLILPTTCIYQFLNHILPMRSGELTLPWLLKRYSNCSYSSSVAQLILTRLYDLISLGFLVTISLLILVNQKIIQIDLMLGWFLLLIVGLGIVGIFFKFIYSKKQEKIIPSILINLIRWIDKNIPQFSHFMKNLSHEFFQEKDIILHLKIMTYSISIWLVLFVIFTRFLWLSGIEISFAQVIVGSSFTNLTQLLPLNTIGNVGSLEAGWVLGFALLGFDSGQVFAVGLLMHTVVILAAGFYAFLSWVLLLQREGSRTNSEVN